MKISREIKAVIDNPPTVQQVRAALDEFPDSAVVRFVHSADRQTDKGWLEVVAKW